MMILTTVMVYFAILFVISRMTSRRANNDTFYRANRRAPWYMVAFGMVGASISGVTFVSVPGMVLTSQMTYLQMCLGFIVGYLVIAFVLLPLYYRLNLTSIYTYLGQRLGARSYMTGACFFLLSKMTGAAVRFYVVCIILQQFVFTPAGIPFTVNVVVMVLLIWLYTRRGGIGTLVFTDSFQTLCLFTALILIILSAVDQLHLSVGEAVNTIVNSDMSRIFVFDDWLSPQNFWKQFLSGVFVAIVMTGLDQDMMQKNLTCKTLRDAQKDMCSYGVAFVPANLLFLALGILLTMTMGTGMKGDAMLPAFVSHSGTVVMMFFTIGIVAASFSSADSALTSLTTCFCVDIRKRPEDEGLRKKTHIAMCGCFMVFILIFSQLNSTSLIDAIYILASYTYGPLLGLFTFGLFTNRQPQDRLVPYICIVSPLLCYLLDVVAQHLWGYHFGYELLMLNGLLTFLGLFLTLRRCLESTHVRNFSNKFGNSLTYSYLCTQISSNMNIEALISKAAGEAVKALYGMDATEKMLQLQKTRSEFEGNLTLVVFPFVKAANERAQSQACLSSDEREQARPEAKAAKKSPEQTAQEIGEYMVNNCSAIEKFNVVKGFLNLSIGDGAWTELLSAIDKDEHFGMKQATEDSPLVMIEYSSPNTNKPLHLGHVRNNLLGWSLAQIMEANGNKVVKTNIVNDRGIHICKSMLAWLKWGNGETPETSGKKGDHLIGDYYVAFDKHYRDEIKELIAQGMDEEKAKQEAPLIKEAHEMLVKWEQNDPEVRALWEKMNNWVYAGFDETYKKMGVSFDKIYYESQTYLKGKAKVEEGLAKGLFERHEDNSVWADLTNEGLDQKLLLRSDGTSVYMTQDIGTAEMRFQDFPIDKMIYVVGNEQNYHFQVLSILLDRLGFKWGKELTHFSYGMVELPNGKMKSREGTVVDADDLMALMVEDAYKTSMELGKFDDMTEEERREIARIVGMGALKYFILKVDARKNMLFNPEESIDFNGNTGPFIQYTYARIRSILRKAEAEGLNPTVTDVSLSEKEVELVQKMNEFGAAVEQAGKDYSPSGIANYCYELTKVFNQFYHDYSILNEPDEQKKLFRLVLAKNVAKIIKNAMGLLGIEVPERM